MEYAKKILSIVGHILKKYRKLISYSIFFAALLLIVLYVTRNWSEFQKISITNYTFLILISLALFINQYVTGKSMDILLRPLGVNLSTKETIGLVSATRLFNQIAPGRLGLALRGAYLKKRYKFPYATFVSSLAATNIIMYTLGSILGILAALFIELNREVLLLILLLAGVLVLIVFTFIFTPRLPENKKGVINYFAKALDGWYIIRRDTFILKRASFWTLLTLLAQAVVAYGAFHALGYALGIEEAVFISALSLLSSLIAITPGGFGITEGVVVGVSVILGIPASLALAAAFLKRIFAFLIALISTFIFAKPLMSSDILKIVKSQDN